jgi:Phage stabilisation protein
MAKPQNTEDGQSYQRHTIQLTREMASRAGNISNKDEDFLNFIFEIVKDKQADDQRSFLLKRAGTADLIASQVANEVRGIYFWEDQGKLLYAANKHIYIYNVATTILTTLTNAFTTTTGDVGFTQYLYDDNTVVVMASDGTTLNRIDTSNAITACTDPDMPVHRPYLLFVDGYLLVVKVNTADMYNSDLNDPFAWTPGNFIAAEMQPDLLLRIAKVNNYVVALGSESVEYFYDAGNATGSPFSRNDSPIKINTYLGGLCQYGNDVYYIGKSISGQPTLCMLKDFKIDELGTPTVIRYLNFVTEAKSTWRTNVISVQGHTLVVVSVGTKTFVYDMENKLWGRWAYKANAAFDIVCSTRVNVSTGAYNVFALKNGDSKIYRFNEALMQDSGTNYTCECVTDQSNFDTLNRKTMSRMALVADRTDSSSFVSVYWTDNDFQSYAGPKSIQLNQDLQSTYILGSFRQRAFKLVYTDQYPLRLQYIEVDINKGIS